MPKKKKQRPSLSPPSSSVGIVDPNRPDIAGFTATPTVIPVERKRSDAAAGDSFLTTPAGRFFHRLFRIFSSLQLAISSLVIFAASMAIATILASNHSDDVANQLVYHTWWFRVLLFSLGINVICAALKKMDLQKLAKGSWPWKKYQTGFLVTHLGLITLVFGGVLDSLAGQEGQIVMVDVPVDGQGFIEDPARNPNSWEQAPNGLRQVTDELQVKDDHQIRISHLKIPREIAADRSDVEPLLERLRNGGGFSTKEVDELEKKFGISIKDWVWYISPGSLPWFDEPGYRANMSAGLRVLRSLAAPIRGKSKGLGDSAKIVLDNFLPSVEVWPYSRKEDAPAHSETFPVLQLKVESMLFDTSAEVWVTGLPALLPADAEALHFLLGAHAHNRIRDGRFLDSKQLNVHFDLLNASHPLQVREFIAPPAPAALGRDGQLVVFVGRKRQEFRITLDPAQLKKEHKLGDTGLTLTVLENADLMDEATPRIVKNPAEMKRVIGVAGRFPVVRFRISSGAESGEYQACARLPNLPVFQGQGKNVADIIAYHHAADNLWSRSVQGGVQFLVAPDEGKSEPPKTFFRAVGPAGEVSDAGESVNLNNDSERQELPWRGAAQTSFLPMHWLPEAALHTTYYPRNLPRFDSGLLPPNHTLALRCRILHGDEELPFTLGLNRPGVHVQSDAAGKHLEIYVARYVQTRKKLPFQVKLHRTRDQKDPGTNRSGAYESNIEVPFTGTSRKPEIHKIYMNHTLDYGGYRFFQANFQQYNDLTFYDENLQMDRKVNHSGIQLSYDPGLYLKYAGTIIVPLGIVIMFYMKAYFFKPRGGRKNLAAA